MRYTQELYSVHACFVCGLLLVDHKHILQGWLICIAGVIYDFSSATETTLKITGKYIFIYPLRTSGH